MGSLLDFCFCSPGEKNKKEFFRGQQKSHHDDLWHRQRVLQNEKKTAWHEAASE